MRNYMHLMDWPDLFRYEELLQKKLKVEGPNIRYDMLLEAIAEQKHARLTAGRFYV